MAPEIALHSICDGDEWLDERERIDRMDGILVELNNLKIHILIKFY